MKDFSRVLWQLQALVRRGLAPFSSHTLAPFIIGADGNLSAAAWWEARPTRTRPLGQPRAAPSSLYSNPTNPTQPYRTRPNLRTCEPVNL